MLGVRSALAAILAVWALLGVPPVLAETENVVINYEALDRLPRHGSGAPAPRLTPLSMVSARTKPSGPDFFGGEGWTFPDSTLAALSNPPNLPAYPPLELVPPSHLGNAPDEDAADRVIAEIMGHGLTGATAKNRQSRTEDQIAVLREPALERLKPPPLSSAPPRELKTEPRVALPQERPSTLPRPSMPEAGLPKSGRVPPNSVQTTRRPQTRSAPPEITAASRPRPMLQGQDGPPPIIAWNEANPIGAVRFAGKGVGVLDIDRASLSELDAIARRLASDDRRVLLKAFAGAAGEKTFDAHTQALKRGLAVRRYLIAKGVPSTLIDVRAAGGATDGGPLDRVDVVPAAS